MSRLQANIHTQAYFQTLLAALESPDTKALHLTRLKRVGLVTGAVLAGTVLGGPIGLIVGAGVAGSKAYHMKHYDDAFAEMLHVLRSLTDAQKSRLVERSETLVGSSDTETVMPFVKSNKQNREKLCNLVSNFLSEEAGYQWPPLPLSAVEEVRKTSKTMNGNGHCDSPYKRLGAAPVDDSPSPIDPEPTFTRT